MGKYEFPVYRRGKRGRENSLWGEKKGKAVNKVTRYRRKSTKGTLEAGKGGGNRPERTMYSMLPRTERECRNEGGHLGTSLSQVGIEEGGKSESEEDGEKIFLGSKQSF